MYTHWAFKYKLPIENALILASVITRISTHKGFLKYKLGFMTQKALPFITEFANFLMESKKKNPEFGEFEFLS